VFSKTNEKCLELLEMARKLMLVLLMGGLAESEVGAD
jgi:hypothetical protein